MDLFEFRLNYKEPGYHKPGDKPFTFPAGDTESKIDANLIEIYGRNGTGKTTMLNVLALALGYLDREKELETKPVLKRKLQDLDENQSLEYEFRIFCEKPSLIDLRINRAKNQKQRIQRNSKPIGSETLAKEIDVIFLTEDDPKRVITASMGKLARYFKDLDNRLNTLEQSLYKHRLEISEFQGFERDEKGCLDEVESHQRKIEHNEAELAKLQEKLKKIQSRDDIKQKLELLDNQETIEHEYQNFKDKYDKLKGKTNTEMYQRILAEQLKLSEEDERLKDTSARILQCCKSLEQYEISIDAKKLLRDEYEEFNKIVSKIEGQKKEKITENEIVEDMIGLLERYQENEEVPIIKRPVGEVLRELHDMKRRFSQDRSLSLLRTLDSIVNDKKEATLRHDKIHEKITVLSRNLKDLGAFERLSKEFTEAEKKYTSLQLALGQDRAKMLSEWNGLRSLKENFEDVRSELQTLETDLLSEEKLKSKCEDRLRTLREAASKKPKYQDKEKDLLALTETITRMRENLTHWPVILQEPGTARTDFSSVKGPGFGLADYQKFVRAVGEFLGKQFEPVAYDNRLHDIEFFDIEKNRFTTREKREIQIDKLSQGQSKITALTGSFKEMKQDKKLIVLIDEIADLDPENLQKVKNILKDMSNEGTLLLAVLVRPTQDSSSKSLEIRGWN